MNESIEWEDVKIEGRELEDGIWVFTFPEGYRTSQAEMTRLKAHISELKLSKPILVWYNPLNIYGMSRQEMIVLRDMLNEYLGGKIRVESPQ